MQIDNSEYIRYGSMQSIPSQTHVETPWVGDLDGSIVGSGTGVGGIGVIVGVTVGGLD